MNHPALPPAPWQLPAASRLAATGLRLGGPMVHTVPLQDHEFEIEMNRPVVTRFAPSPTGMLHIGSARAALFNWVFARKMGGKMLLRIEDTDRERSTEAAVAAILDGLRWLGLDWDGEPISQFARAARHAEVAHELVDKGLAYKCYCSPDELTAMREAARAAGKPPRYDGTWRDRDPSEAPEGVAPVVRIKAPQTGEITVRDHVQGDVVFKCENLDDFIILRSDGNPTYMHAVVVDDHDMEVTHILRGDDHLTNAARQIVIYNAMGWDVPEMAHMPLIHGPDGAKFSKRHGAPGVASYRQMGYLPEAMRNYLARLGWSHGDAETFSSEQMIEWFSLDDINKGAARFDFARLESLNGIYIRAADPARLYQLMVELAEENGLGSDHAGLLALKDMVLAALPELQPRAKTILELIDLAQFTYATRPLVMLPETGQHFGEGVRALIGELHGIFSGLDEWSVESLDGAARSFAAEKGVKLGKIAQPLRAALTGKTISPGVFEVMVLIGREESLARIGDQAEGA